MRRRAAALGCLLSLAAPAAAHFEDGMIFVVDRNHSRVYYVNAANGWKWNTSLDWTDGLSVPGAIQFSGHGDLLVANWGNDELWSYEEDLSGTRVLTAADGLDGPAGPNGLAIDGSHAVFVCNANRAEILRFAADWTGGQVFADAADGLVNPTAVAFLADGRMLVANQGSGGQVLVFDAAGNASAWAVAAGEDVHSLVIRRNGDVYAACNSGNVIRWPGGDASNPVLLGTYGGTAPALQLDPDHTVLYHVNRGDGKLRTIDPDTGAAQVRVAAAWDPVGIGVVGSQLPPGTFGEFGDSLAGAGGVLPELHGEGTPRLGQPIAVEIHDFVGGARAWCFLGAGRTELPLFGGELYVDLTQWYQVVRLKLPGTPGSPGEGDLDLPYTLPNDPLLVATRWYVQVAALDAAAPQGVALTHGLLVYIGQ